MRKRITCPVCTSVWITHLGSDGKWRYPAHYPTDGQQCRTSWEFANENEVADDS